MKSLAAQRTRDCAVRADKPEIESELMGDGKREGMAASGDEDDFDAGSVSAAEGGEIVGGNLELRVEEGAIDIGGDEADGRGFCVMNLRRAGEGGFGHPLL